MVARRNAIYLVIIGALFAGLFTGRAIFLNIAYLFGGILLLSMVWAWFAVRAVRIARMTRSRRAQVGRSFAEYFRVHNSGWLPKLWLEIRDHSTLPGHSASHVVPSLWSKQQYEWQIDTPCTVRGEFQLGPLTITSGDPFGLFLAPRRINAVERIIVYPAMVPVDSFSLPIGLLSGGEAQRYITQNVTTNAAGVRDYVPGDSINRVHWRSTARRDRLIVKEFELDPMVDIWLFVDFSAQSLVESPNVQRVSPLGALLPGTQMIPPSTEEYAAVIAASLARHFIDDQRALGFSAYLPRREVLQPERGDHQLTRILESLAIARSLSDYPLHAMLALEAHRFTRGTTLVIVTSSLNPRWVQELQVIVRRGVRPTCVFIDPSSFDKAYQSEEIRGMLQLARIPHIPVQQGEGLSAALSQRPI